MKSFVSTLIEKIYSAICLLVNIAGLISIIFKIKTSNMHTVIHSDLFWWFLMVFLLSIIGYTYWFVSYLLFKIKNLDLRNRLLNAYIFENLNTKILRHPTKESFDEADVSIDDLRSIGIKEYQIDSLIKGY